MSNHHLPNTAPPADEGTGAGPMNAANRWLNAEEAGRYLSYSAWSIRAFAKRGMIRHTKAPGQSGGYRFRREWLDEFLESRAIPVRDASTIAAAETIRRAKSQAMLAAANKSAAVIDPDLAKAVERAQRRMGESGSPGRR